MTRRCWWGMAGWLVLAGCPGTGKDASPGGETPAKGDAADAGLETFYVLRDADGPQQLDPGEWNLEIHKKGLPTATKAKAHAWCDPSGKVREVICSSGPGFCEVDGDLTTEECTWKATRVAYTDEPRTCQQVCGSDPCQQPTANLKSCTPRQPGPLQEAPAEEPLEAAVDIGPLQLDPGEWNFEVVDKRVSPERRGQVTVHSFCDKVTQTTREFACHVNVLCPPGADCQWTPLSGTEDAEKPPVDCAGRNPCAPGQTCEPVAGSKPC